MGANRIGMVVFIEWKGEDCPTDSDALVQCIFGDGSMDVHPAHYWDWNSKHSPIIGYRVVPATTPKRDGSHG